MRGNFLALVALLVGVGTAGAESIQDQRGLRYSVVTPPAYWFGRPALTRIIDVVKMPEDQVRATCVLANGNAESFGCVQIFGQARCRIVISDELPLMSQMIVEYHERAHCHGWPAEHPTD